MSYQLVIKFKRKSLSDEAFLAEIEEGLKKALGDAVELEGYVVGPKEINLFMLASDPRHGFRRAKDVLEELGVVKAMASAVAASLRRPYLRRGAALHSGGRTARRLVTAANQLGWRPAESSPAHNVTSDCKTFTRAFP